MAKKVAFCFGYFQLNHGAATLEEFRSRLSKFALRPTLHLLSILNALLRDDVELINQNAHDAAVKRLLEPAIAETILKSGRFAFHRQQILFLMLEAILNCKGDERDWGDEDYYELGILALMGSDLLPTLPPKSTNELQHYIRFILHFAPVQEAAGHKFKSKIARSFLMLTESLEKLKHSGMYVDIKETFKAATGLTVEQFFSLMLASIIKFMSFDEKEYVKNPLSYALTTSWFEKTKLPHDAIQDFLDSISSPPETLTEQINKRHGPSDFTALRNKPMFQDKSGYFPADFDFLAEKTEASIYWTVFGKLTTTQKGAFQAFWGKLFEQYITDCMASVADPKLNKVIASPVYRDDTAAEATDLLVLSGKTAVLIELKGTMFRGDAKYSGGLEVLEDEVVKKFVEDGGKPAGIGQIANALRAINSDRTCIKDIDLSEIETVYPVLVTRDDIGEVVGFNKYLNEKLGPLLPDKKNLTLSVAPLVCLTSETIELWSAYLDVIPLSEILHSHLVANENVTDPVFKQATPLPASMVENSVLQKFEHRSPLKGVWEKLSALAIETLGLEPEEVVSPK
jgi:hypothetical protein